MSYKVLDRLLLDPAKDKPWPGQFQKKPTLVPQQLGLKVGDVLEFWAWAEDNKTPAANRTETSHRRGSGLHRRGQKNRRRRAPTPWPKTIHAKTSPTTREIKTNSQKPASPTRATNSGSAWRRRSEKTPAVDEKETRARRRKGENKPGDGKQQPW